MLPRRYPRRPDAGMGLRRGALSGNGRYPVSTRQLVCHGSGSLLPPPPGVDQDQDGQRHRHASGDVEEGQHDFCQHAAKLLGLGQASAAEMMPWVSRHHTWRVSWITGTSSSSLRTSLASRQGRQQAMPW